MMKQSKRIKPHNLKLSPLKFLTNYKIQHVNIHISLRGISEGMRRYTAELIIMGEGGQYKEALMLYIYQGCAGRSFFQRGGARTKIRGAGRGKRTRKSTDPKIRPKCVYCYGDICSVL